MKSLFEIFLIFLIIVATSCSSKDAPRDAASESKIVESIEGREPEPVEAAVILPEETPKSSLSEKEVAIPVEAKAKPPQTILGPRPGNGDEEIEEPSIVNEPRTGKLAVYCPHQMTYKQSSDVIGFIADLIDDELIKDMISGRVSEILNEDDFTVGDDDFLIKKLQFSNQIELRLDDADNEGFTIKKMHEDDLQLISDNMEGWHWKVTPTTNDSKQQLVLKVIAYDSDGKLLTSFGKTYHINIKIESRIFWRNTFTLFVENPEWAFASIITPMLTFIVGRYNGRRKKKKRKRKEKSA